MDTLRLQDGDIVLTYEPEARGLSIIDGGARTPWSVDLGDTATVAVRAVGGTTATIHRVALADLTLRKLGPGQLQWVGEVGGAECAFEIRLEDGAVVFTVTPLGSAEADVVSADWPGEISLRSEVREICWANSRQGALFRADGRPWHRQENLDHVAMRFCGLTTASASLAVIADTSADARWHLADDGKQTMSARVEFLPSMGSLAYARSLRLIPLREPGYLQVAQAFRRYAQQTGLWMSWQERVAQNPLAEKLQGAFLACAGYWFDEGADQVGVMRQMREYGFNRGCLFSPKMIVPSAAWANWLGVEPNHMTDAQLDDIQSLGYVAAPFLQVEEAAEDFQGGRCFARTAEGDKLKRWQIGDYSFYEIAKWHVRSTLPRYEDQLQACQGVHFDTLTAMSLAEHYGDRSYDRRGDIALRLELARYYRDRGKLVVSEGLRDWSVRLVDLATSKTFCPVEAGDGRVWTVPLSDLVYHDSCVRVSWEHHPYDDDRCVHSLLERRYHPFGPHLMNLLTCSPPVLFPEGMLYEYEHREVVREDGEKELEVVWDRAAPYRKRFTDKATQEALPKALEACRLHERHGAARMLSHRFPDPGYRCLQESEFASGLHVTVNFGDEAYTVADGRTVPPRSALVEGA
jgi:hypothetical protein